MMAGAQFTRLQPRDSQADVSAAHRGRKHGDSGGPLCGPSCRECAGSETAGLQRLVRNRVPDRPCGVRRVWWFRRTNGVYRAIRHGTRSSPFEPHEGPSAHRLCALVVSTDFAIQSRRSAARITGAPFFCSGGGVPSTIFARAAMRPRFLSRRVCCTSSATWVTMAARCTRP
jgi:hypothetical protein